mgnify:CR=1 FL=1
MVEDYIKVASGKTPAHYYDERLRPILEETFGTMVYQEQIMQGGHEVVRVVRLQIGRAHHQDGVGGRVRLVEGVGVRGVGQNVADAIIAILVIAVFYGSAPDLGEEQRHEHVVDDVGQGHDAHMIPHAHHHVGVPELQEPLVKAGRAASTPIRMTCS